MKVTTVKNGVENESEILSDTLNENYLDANKEVEHGNFFIYMFCFIFIVVALGIGTILGKSMQIEKAKIEYSKTVDAKIIEHKKLKAEKISYLSGAFAIQDKINNIEMELEQQGIKLYQNDN